MIPDQMGTRGNARSAALRGITRVPPDKAISHRAAMLAAIATGRSVIHDFSASGDASSTIAVLRSLGVRIVRTNARLEVTGDGIRGLAAPETALDCGRSATTMRLMAGVLAAAPFPVRLTGDPQLLARPMDRIAEPLRRMGATVEWRARHDLVICGGELAGIEHRSDVPSAQVKSSVLLAGLHASGTTAVIEAVPTRDHTERLLEAMGVSVRVTRHGNARSVSVQAQAPQPIELSIPGDPSSAAVIAAAVALVPGSEVTIEGVGLNPTRTGFMSVLARMGARVEARLELVDPEPVGSIHIRYHALRATTVAPAEVPAMVDELPLLALVATQAEGVTEVRGAAELRQKESDRIRGAVEALRSLGADVQELPDGFAVQGPTELHGGWCEAHRDHRLAMMLRLAGLIASEPVRFAGAEYIDDSYPGFERALERLR